MLMCEFHHFHHHGSQVFYFVNIISAKEKKTICFPWLYVYFKNDLMSFNVKSLWSLKCLQSEQELMCWQVLVSFCFFCAFVTVHLVLVLFWVFLSLVSVLFLTPKCPDSYTLKKKPNLKRLFCLCMMSKYIENSNYYHASLLFYTNKHDFTC